MAADGVPVVINEKIMGKFRIQSRVYEVVDFLDPTKLPVDCDEMLRRAAKENGGAIGEEDEEYILKYRSQLPRELQRCRLITGRRHPGNRRFISEIYCRDGQWRQFWRELDDQYDSHTFVVRRVR